MMFRSRLALKITLLIVAVLIVGFGISTIVTNPARVGRARRAEQAGGPTAHPDARGQHRGRDGAGAARRHASLIQELRELRARPVHDATPLQSLMIYRRNGVEAFTDLATATRSPAPPGSRTTS